MPLETDKGMTTVLLFQPSGRHWDWGNSQISVLVSRWAQPSLGAARTVGELGMCSGAPLRQGLSLLHWNHLSSVAQSGRTGGLTASPSTALSRDPQETWEAERSLLSWEAHTAWMADKPPTQTGSKLRVCPGEWIYKVPLVLGTKSNVQDILQQTAALQLVLAPLCTACRGTPISRLYNRLLPFSHGGK